MLKINSTVVRHNRLKLAGLLLTMVIVSITLSSNVDFSRLLIGGSFQYYLTQLTLTITPVLFGLLCLWLFVAPVFEVLIQSYGKKSFHFEKGKLFGTKEPNVSVANRDRNHTLTAFFFAVAIVGKSVRRFAVLASFLVSIMWLTIAYMLFMSNYPGSLVFIIVALAILEPVSFLMLGKENSGVMMMKID